MIVYPNAKINIGLRVLSKRSDGFHNIETGFYPVSLCDVLEFVECSGNVEFNSTGISIPGEQMENICVRAWEILHERFQIPPVKIHLHKIIPIGAGLGGGSADGAFMLKGLSDLFSLKLEQEELLGFAAELGSDCPFFLLNIPAIGSGRGELLEPLNIKLENFKLVLVNPGIHVSTAIAYGGVIPREPDDKLSELLENPVEFWGRDVFNDFEPGVFEKFPEIAEIKQKLIDLGASYAAMSGSGSTVFGLFKDRVPDLAGEVFKKYYLYYEK